MTEFVDTSSQYALRARRRAGRNTIIVVALAVAAFAGAGLGYAHRGDVSAFEPALVVLLRFMAISKAAVCLGAAALLLWRNKRPLGERTLAVYLGALILMAVAPGAIWFLGLIAPGAVIFHAGFLAYLVMAAGDEDLGKTFLFRRR